MNEWKRFLNLAWTPILRSVIIDSHFGVLDDEG